MNLSQLYYFRKLAELQHYTRAAKELYITQPALSDAIKSLEKELGVPLFQREGRNVVLTRYGKEFAGYVMRALQELDKGVAIMHEYTGGLSGTLRIGGLYTVTGDYLPRLLNAYSENFGDSVSFVISQGFTLQLIEGLKAGNYDVVFCALKDDEPSLCFEPVVAYQLVVGVNKDNPLAERTSVSLEDLRGKTVFTYREGTPIGNEVNRIAERYGVKVRPEYDDEITMGGMLANDRHGACGLLTYTIGLKPFSDLVLIPIDEAEVPRNFHHVYMAYKSAEFKSRVLESFIDFTAGFIPPEGTVPSIDITARASSV